MKEMEPFILGTKNVPKVEINSSPKDAVAARAFVSDDGRLRVVIVGTGGKCSAVITVPGATSLKSQFGLTKSLGEGRYEFHASEVNSDILY